MWATVASERLAFSSDSKWYHAERKIVEFSFSNSVKHSLGSKKRLLLVLLALLLLSAAATTDGTGIFGLVNLESRPALFRIPLETLEVW